MKRHVKKIIGVLLTLCLMSGMLAGCSSVREASPADNRAQTDTGTDTDAKTDAGTTSPDTPDSNGAELDIFINESWWPVDTWTGIIPEAITKATGVKLNVTIAADENQLGLMIASNELPDLIFTQYETDRLSSKEFCYSYNELLNSYYPDYKFNETQVNIAKSFSSDDNYYTILSNFSTGEEWEKAAIAPGQAAVYYRQDIYEALGSPAMETKEDFLKVLGLVKEKYPNMTPYGLGGVWKLQPVSSWLGAAGSNIFQYLDDGSVVYKSSVPAYKDFLKYANTMALNGYITVEDYANTSEADSHQKAYNDGFFAYSWYLSPSNFKQLGAESQKLNPEAKWMVLKPLGGANGAYDSGKGWCGLFVSRSCKNAEAAAKFVTYMYGEEGRRLSAWGREEIDYTIGGDGEPTWSEEWIAAAKDPLSFNKEYNNTYSFGVTGIESLYPTYAGLDNDLKAAFATYKNNYEMHPEIGIAIPKSGSDEGIIQTKLQEMIEAEEAKVIFSANDSEFEAAFKNLQDNAEKIGVGALNSYMTQKVNEVKAELGY